MEAETQQFKFIIISWGILFLVPLLAIAQETATKPNNKLADQQQLLASRYAQLEALLLRMSQMESGTNPRRAALLLQAIELSKKQHTRIQLEAIVAALSKKQFSKAMKDQVSVEGGLEELLKLLQSEDRSQELKSEQDRIKEYLKDLERLSRIQRSLQGQTEGDANAEALRKEQEQLANRARALNEKITENEKPPQEEQNNLNEKNNSEESAAPSSDDKNKENKPNENEPQEKPDSANNNENPASDMPPSSDNGQPQSKTKPVQERLKAAEQRMRAAQQKLAESKRKESSVEQQKANDELEKAKAELEKILQQLREEELERALTTLEARFRKMIEMQARILDSTKKLDAIPTADRTRELDVQAGRLSADESKIILEAEKALQLLQEEGSSIAFPATLEQSIEDMRQVAQRLNQGKVDPLTQGLEEDILQSLQEQLAAVEESQKDLEDQKQQQQNQPQEEGGAQEAPLVNAIQELKMIKSLQLRVNSRTDRYSKMLADASDPLGQANTPELEASLQKLGIKQQQVFEILREILLGKNQ